MTCDNKITRFNLSEAGNTPGFAKKIFVNSAALLAHGCTQVSSVCADQSGNIFVCDSGQNIILRIGDSGKVSLYAGQAGVSGNNFGETVANLDALFNEPNGIACDNSGNVFVADSGNNQIRKISSTSVSTIAGDINGSSGFVDSTTNGYDARFNYPIDVAISNSGIVYVSDYLNHAIRKINQSGNVLTMSGLLSGAMEGDEENTRTDKFSPQLRFPVGLAMDTYENLFVLDSGNFKIKKITPNGYIYLHSGSGVSGTYIGNIGGSTPATCQSFTCQYGSLRFCDIDKQGNIYLVDNNLDGLARLLKINSNGQPFIIADFNGDSDADCIVSCAVNPGPIIYVTYSGFDTYVSSSSSGGIADTSSSTSSSISSVSSASSNSSSSSSSNSSLSSASSNSSSSSSSNSSLSSASSASSNSSSS